MFEAGIANASSARPPRRDSRRTPTPPPPKTSVCMNWRPLIVYAVGAVALLGPLVIASLSISDGSALIVAATRRTSPGLSGGKGQGTAKRTLPPCHELDETAARTCVMPGLK